MSLRKGPPAAKKAYHAAASKRWRELNPERYRQQQRDAKRRKYGITCTPTRPMPELCEIGCGRKAECLDHDHVTGAFRGWLCRTCNRGLGLFGDSVNGVRAALNYLEGKCASS